MTKLRVVVLLAVVALLLFPALALADTPPEPPCRFYGTVIVDGAGVADGTVITAMIGGDQLTTATPAEGYSSSTYAIKIGVDTEYTEGATVTFMIGDRAAAQTGTWAKGGNIEVNLTAGQAGPQAGAITDVQVTSLAAGSDPTVDWDPVSGVLTVGIPDGATGPAGAAGADGPQGEEGAGAPGGIALPVVALVIAVIAVGVAVMSMRRRI
ncbi:MAG: hypothetical protein MUP90_14030 [Gammaproteobacteria bacterium]|nr:hypothetical protein [Gammaproteobacteria bacterium]